MQSNQESDLSLVSVYKLIVHHWKLIATVCLVCVVLAAVILLFTKNRYKNVSVFFPASEQIIDKSTLLDESTYNGATIFAPESVVDRVYNISISSAVQNFVIKNNDLIAHYGYDKDSPRASEKASKKYSKRVKVKRTAYNSLELTVVDEDYKKAAKIATDVLDKTEEIYHGFFLSARRNLMANIDSQIALKNQQVKSWGDSLAALRDQYRFYGVISPHRSQATIPSTGSVNGSGFEKIQNLEELKERALTDISNMRSRRSEIELTAGENHYFLNVVKMPTPSMQKAGPMRTLTVLLTAVFSFIAMVIILILHQRYTKLKTEAGV